jgi:Ca-activated chloride channel family protein
MTRSALLLAGTAFLIGSAAPPPLPAAPLTAGAAAAQDRSPVRCNAGDDRELRALNRSSGVPLGYAPPPPPPPPAPPPPTYAPAPQAEIAVTGVRAGLQQAAPVARSRDAKRLAPGYVPPSTPQYGAPGNTERYDG